MYLFFFSSFLFWPPDYLHETLSKPVAWEDFDRNFPVVVEELWEGIQHFILKAFKGRERERQKGGQKERTKEFRGMHYSALLEITLFTGSTKPKCPGGFHYLSFSNAARKKKLTSVKITVSRVPIYSAEWDKSACWKKIWKGGWGRETVQFLHLSIFLTLCSCVCVCVHKTHSFKYTHKQSCLHPTSTELFVYLHAGQFCKSHICQELGRFTCIDL